MGKKLKPGDTRVAKNGYTYIVLPNGKHETMQRYVMKQHLGRELRQGERVSFINGKIDDFRIENLKLTQAATKSIDKQLAELHAKKEDIEARIAELEREREKEQTLAANEG